MCEPTPLQYGGYCQTCATQHGLPNQPALTAARTLIHDLETKSHNSPFSTTSLFGKARGKMLGVLLGCDQNGEQLILKAFSGQHDGQWLIPGWAPPLFNVDDFNALNIPGEKKIKNLSRKIDQTTNKGERLALKAERKSRSQTLMKELHKLYHLHNFRGESKPMADFFPGNKGMPTGAGDCCAPKLIHAAQQQNLVPMAMLEFYFGRDNKSKTRQHGLVYPPCQSGCAPILGFMLCGL